MSIHLPSHWKIRDAQTRVAHTTCSSPSATSHNRSTAANRTLARARARCVRKSQLSASAKTSSRIQLSFTRCSTRSCSLHLCFHKQFLWLFTNWFPLCRDRARAFDDFNWHTIRSLNSNKQQHAHHGQAYPNKLPYSIISGVCAISSTSSVLVGLFAHIAVSVSLSSTKNQFDWHLLYGDLLCCRCNNRSVEIYRHHIIDTTIRILLHISTNTILFFWMNQTVNHQFGQINCKQRQ